MQSEITAVNADFDTLILEAEKFCERRNPAARQLIEKAGELAVPGDLRQAALLQYINAFFDCFVRNNYDEAIRHLTAALDTMDENLYPVVGYKLLMTLGNSYQLKGDLFSAQENYLKGLKTLSFKQPGLTHIEKIFMGAFYYNLATLLSNTELAMESNDYLENAIKIYKEIDNKFKLSQMYVAYAQMLEHQHNYTKAIDYLNQALAIGEEINDPYSTALAMANLGAISIKAGEPREALLHFKTALQYYEANGMNYETGMVKLEMGRAFQHTGQLEKALELFSEAEQLMIGLDNKKELSEIYRVKATALTAHGKHKESNEYLEKYIESLKFFFDHDKTKALAQAKQGFEWELKEKETQLLRELHEQQIQYSNKLQASNNELMQFASVASHDLREPLRMISSYLQLLKKDLGETATKQQNEFCDYAMDGAKRMDRLIQDLLRLARVDANTHIERVNLQNVIAEVQMNLGALIKESNASINATGLPVIFADRAQMMQLFQNLVANAINYNNSGAPAINISTVETREALEITVADNGVGIPQHFKESAFQIFKTMANKTTVKGTGIGLAICKKIVERMQGTITIEDNPTGGTIFRITFGPGTIG